jgi:hypothetical protein
MASIAIEVSSYDTGLTISDVRMSIVSGSQWLDELRSKNMYNSLVGSFSKRSRQQCRCSHARCGGRCCCGIEWIHPTQKLIPATRINCTNSCYDEPPAGVASKTQRSSVTRSVAADERIVFGSKPQRNEGAAFQREHAIDRSIELIDTRQSD